MARWSPFRTLCVEVGSKPCSVDFRFTTEESNGCFGANKTMATHRRDFADWHAVSSDYERLAFIEPAHDVATGIPQLPLGDGPLHIRQSSTPCYALTLPKSR